LGFFVFVFVLSPRGLLEVHGDTWL
jgi:hypothetical protein